MPPLPLEAVHSFAERARSAYPKTSRIWEALVGVADGEDGLVTDTNHTSLGVRLDSPDGRFVIQARVNGFTVSRLSPYGQWADLRDEAVRWWNDFAQASDIQVVTRVAVRYINSIPIPLPLGEFEEYLTCAPRVPSGLPQALISFLHRVDIPDDEKNCFSVITQALEKPYSKDGQSYLPVVLDVDVSRSTTIDRKDVRELTACLEDLRAQKNRIFFASITPKTVEMLK